MDDDFNLFTDDDRATTAYRMCVAGTTITGAAVGRWGGLYGVLAGGAAGLAYGLMTCKKLSPYIERKLFSRNAKLSDAELSKVLKEVRNQTGVRSKSSALALLADARREMFRRGPTGLSAGS